MANKEKSDETLKKEVDESAKLFDVASPGKTAASATSRPIIVKHGSIVKHDPMVVKDDADNNSKHEETAKPATRELKIQPDETPTVTEAETETAAETKPSEPEVTYKDEEPETDEPAEGAANSQDSTESGTGAVNALANEVDAKQADKKLKKELEERNLELEKIIVSKEFFVPIGVASRRRSNQRILWLLILVVLIGLAALNFAVDAEVIDIGVQSFTDLL